MTEIRYNAGFDSPGPIYRPKSTNTSPQVSMSSRYKVRDLEVTPGPGYYEYTTSYDMNAEHGATLASRTYVKRKHYGPGPAAYSPQRGGPRTQSPTLGSRTSYPGTMDWSLKRVTQTPAGNAYNLPSQRSYNAPSFGQRTVIKQKWPSPGPGKYNTRDLAAKIIRPTSPQFSIREKCKEIHYEDYYKNAAVCPNTYQKVASKKSPESRGCTFGGRTNRGIVVFCQ